MAGNFYESARDVRVQGSVLFADLRNVDGEWVPAEINLDEYLGNEDGHFVWEGSEFSHSAEQIEFSFEGEDNVPILRALLYAEEQLRPDNINLGERIININGEFQFQVLGLLARENSPSIP
ncbi:Cyanovirin-N [Aspergillus transmontanensis]|uniref:Cyanovirin-N n=1 Tax=Aspergillus transmontanensis TaxID=1034304 RepID=A0A5N6VPE2_9EURO|nr:Cyanovirin-N [Aspergillus transmontanensis]